ncbi:putative F420-dependent oxidoreductase [Antricoccus suffuscus]|uniref:Putative F420-dependent oxidoreductase n=1 Tax=Antricoccus suffuscus TaxID=1629062 RepID=A0A2T1A182_9ACTN|nr:LLM class flavin-dependent oxidoreductase [Antricoccus suffuscus]PRZ42247.1 putative F420-dependent oxidoreductase [Antricoccus suffuscus]
MRVALTLGGDQSKVAEEARQAEAAGFDMVATGEHLFFHGPVPNAFVSLAAAAGATTKIRLLSSLTVLPLYPPALAAKLATSLDQVSGGRFDLGVGVGGEFPDEFTAAGVEVKERGARTNEALEILKAFWSGERVQHKGKFAHVPGLAIKPGAVQSGGPPLWMGGRKDAAICRAGRYADFWMPYMYTPEQLAESLGKVRDEAERAGRDPQSVRGAIYCWSAVDEDGTQSKQWVVDAVSTIYQQDFSKLADRYLLFGSPDQVAARVAEYRDAGAETLVFAPVADGRRRQQIVDVFAGHVLPNLHS